MQEVSYIVTVMLLNKLGFQRYMSIINIVWSYQNKISEIKFLFDWFLKSSICVVFFSCGFFQQGLPLLGGIKSHKILYALFNNFIWSKLMIHYLEIENS